MLEMVKSSKIYWVWFFKEIKKLLLFLYFFLILGYDLPNGAKCILKLSIFKFVRVICLIFTYPTCFFIFFILMSCVNFTWIISMDINFFFFLIFQVSESIQSSSGKWTCVSVRKNQWTDLYQILICHFIYKHCMEICGF